MYKAQVVGLLYFLAHTGFSLDYQQLAKTVVNEHRTFAEQLKKATQRNQVLMHDTRQKDLILPKSVEELLTQHLPQKRPRHINRHRFQNISNKLSLFGYYFVDPKLNTKKKITAYTLIMNSDNERLESVIQTFGQFMSTQLTKEQKLAFLISTYYLSIDYLKKIKAFFCDLFSKPMHVELLGLIFENMSLHHNESQNYLDEWYKTIHAIITQHLAHASSDFKGMFMAAAVGYPLRDLQDIEKNGFKTQLDADTPYLMVAEKYLSKGQIESAQELLDRVASRVSLRDMQVITKILGSHSSENLKILSTLSDTFITPQLSSAQIAQLCACMIDMSSAQIKSFAECWPHLIKLSSDWNEQHHIKLIKFAKYSPQHIQRLRRIIQSSPELLFIHDQENFHRTKLYSVLLSYCDELRAAFLKNCNSFYFNRMRINEKLRLLTALSTLKTAQKFDEFMDFFRTDVQAVLTRRDAVTRGEGLTVFVSIIEQLIALPRPKAQALFRCAPKIMKFEWSFLGAHYDFVQLIENYFFPLCDEQVEVDFIEYLAQNSEDLQLEHIIKFGDFESFITKTLQNFSYDESL